AMGEAAVAAARAVGYEGAGTVEFIVADDRFAFMEMNTRLQVEHPVTEAITGLDLVEWQFRVAAGEPLPTLAPTLRGHAIEVRLYAEDPAHDYRPSVGLLSHLVMPDSVRVETGVRAGDRIDVHYDAMIAKLVASGTDRAEALRRLSTALRATEIAGVVTNLGLLRGIVSHAEFAAGGVDTGFLARHPELAALGAAPPPPEAIAAAALAVLARDPPPDGPWAVRDAWRMNMAGHRRIHLRAGDAALTVAARPLPAGPLPAGLTELAWHDRVHRAALHGKTLVLDDRTSRVAVLDAGNAVTAIVDGGNHRFTLVDPLAPPATEAASAGRTIAPIPGRVASVLVKPGDRVTRGQPLVVLEAMKMELTLSAASDGEVREVRCRAGDMVEEQVELVTLAA
ncbi:MAG: biotin/lipoyl-binding protein, partial [Acetobacteraceae bacterium]|nr:biotin/lipoyl-binding protein [Acetobacteraceae bacterium]